MMRNYIILFLLCFCIGCLSACSSAIKATDFEASANIDPVVVQKGGDVDVQA